MCRIGHGNFAGRNAFSARRRSTIESLPPLNSSTGLSDFGRDLAHDVDGLVLERVHSAAHGTRRRLGHWARCFSSVGLITASLASDANRAAQDDDREPDWRLSGAAGAGTPARISIVGPGSRAKSS